MNPVRIERIAAGGEGVGRLPDGRAVFVPRSAPGDLVTLADLRLHARMARARLERVVEPGPDRVEPRCRHYTADDCGGCQLQHLSSAAQRRARSAIVGDALRRIGHLSVDDPPLAPAAREWGYRARVRLHRDRSGVVGLRPLGAPTRAFDLDYCHIAAPPLMDLWRAIRPRRELLPADLERLVLRLDPGGGRHAIAETGGSRVWSHAGELAAACERAGAPARWWWRPADGAARVVAGGDTPYPVTAFEQVNPVMGDQVRRRALALLGAEAGEHIWDLYAGTGDATVELAWAGASVESVELDRQAVAAAGRRGPSGPAIRRVTGRVEDVVDRLAPPDRVLANPPRVGMAAAVLRALRARRPRRIVYVSCDPATLARDLARLADYRMGAVESCDLFPQTAHVETIAVLEPG